MNSSAEWNLMIVLCKLNITGKPIMDFEIFSRIDWDIFYNMIKLHRVIPFVYYALLNLEMLDLVPAQILTKLEAKKRRTVKHNFKLTEELVILNRILTHSNIDFIPYKGIILTHLVYKDFGSRQTADLDILVHAKDLERINNELAAHGYDSPERLSSFLQKKLVQSDCEIQFSKTSKSRNVSIDTHWKVGNAMLQLEVGIDELLPYTEERNIFGGKFRLVKPEALFILTAMHHCGKEDLIQLKQITDLALIIQVYNHEINWDKLIQIATKWKVLKMALFSIDLVNKVYGIKIHNSLTQSLVKYRINQKTQHHMKRLLSSEGKVYINSIQDFMNRMVFQIGLRESFSTKLKMIYYHVLQVILPNPNDFAFPQKATKSEYYFTILIKPKRLLWTYLMS